jgi:radical SAM superfamily enzyme YgiQ (UPF0313 family)
MKKAKILYIYPYESYGKSNFLINFIRISNYLNSRASKLNGQIEEEYLDLRFEKLPKFIPKNLNEYRLKLAVLLNKISKRFAFNVVAISCYSSHNYLNTVEVASFIKSNIFPNPLIIVGGVHATMIPNDFQPGNLPRYLFENVKENDNINLNTTPFDYLIKEEGEITFFKIIKDFLDEKIKPRKDLTQLCTIIEPELFANLDELPLLNLSLYEKYKEAFKIDKNFNIDFSRGCFFRCHLCPTSEDYMESYKCVRFKSIDKCIQELKIIRDTPWLKVDTIYIVDLTFLPKRNERRKFYEKLNIVFRDEGKLPFKIFINERNELCTDEDLYYYKKFNIIPCIGLETGSKTLLYRIGKVLGTTELQIKSSVDRFLKKTEEIILKANQLGIEIIFFYLIGLPGATKKTFKENIEFFTKPRINGNSLLKKNNINLIISKYMALFGSEIYTNAETKYSATIYFKEWWKIFDEKITLFGALVDPSKDYNLIECLNDQLSFIKDLFKIQIKRHNNYYSFADFYILKENMKDLLKLYEVIKKY